MPSQSGKKAPRKNGISEIHLQIFFKTALLQQMRTWESEVNKTRWKCEIEGKERNMIRGYHISDISYQWYFPYFY